MPNRKAKSDSLHTDQHERLVEAARAFGADEDEVVFKAKLGVIARKKRKADPEPPKDSE